MRVSEWTLEHFPACTTCVRVRFPQRVRLHVCAPGFWCSSRVGGDDGLRVFGERASGTEAITSIRGYFAQTLARVCMCASVCVCVYLLKAAVALLEFLR